MNVLSLPKAIHNFRGVALSGFDIFEGGLIFKTTMMQSIRSAFFILSAVFLFQSSHAQSDVRVTIAGLQQDVNLLAQEMKSLRLEMAEMRRENERLRAQVAAATASSSTQTQIASLSSAIDVLRAEYRRADEAQKQQIVAEVTRQIDAFAKETQVAIDIVAKAIDSTPNVSTPVRFSEDFPRTGEKYVVRSGDTLSKIAKEFGSTVKDIQNANKIANPSRDLQVGQTIFIPIAQ
ncbi:MAG: LysM peptidoglycan-binding domain-containing protein [Verrucomicrobiota bacterium]